MTISSSLEEFTNNNSNIISRPPSVLYRYHKTPIHVSSNIKSAYDFPLGVYNPTTIQQQIIIDYHYIENDNKKSKTGLFGTLRRMKNKKKSTSSTSSRNSSISSRDSMGYEEIEIGRRYSV